MGAMPGEAPAVVQCPYHGLAALPQVAEQQRVVDIIAVYVVQVHDVGIDAFHLPD